MPLPRVSNFLSWVLNGLKGQIYGVFAVGISVGVLDVVLASLVGRVVNQIVNLGVSRDALLELSPEILLAVLLFAGIKPGLQIFETHWKMVSLFPRVVPVVAQRLFDNVLARSTSQVASVDPSRFSHKIMRTAGVTSGFLMDVLNAFSLLVGTLLAVLFLLWGLDPVFLIGLFIWLSLAMANILFFLPRLRKASTERAHANTEVTGEFVDALSNLCSIKLFANEAFESKSANFVLSKLRTASTNFGRQNAYFRANLFLLIGLLPIGLQGGAILLWWQGVSGPGEVLALGLIAARISAATSSASLSMMLIYRNLGEIEYGMTLLNEIDSFSSRQSDALVDFSSKGIVFDSVDFSYPGREFKLSDISLKIPPSSITAIVGSSGSGKSTLISILLGLEQPVRGVVNVGSVAVDKMSDSLISQTFAIAGQTEVPFNRTLYDNVRYGRMEANDQEIEDVLCLVGLQGFIGLGDKSEPLGTAGRSLSGGQRQRVLIARALLRDPPILVLDEATSALDYPSERELLAKIAEFRAGKMTIIVTHRPSALPAFDHVVVIEDGKIIECCSMDLVDEARRYFELHFDLS